VRLPGKILVFVPARSIRLLPAPVPAIVAASRAKNAVVPSITPLGGPQGMPASPAAGGLPAFSPTAGTASGRAPAPSEPLAALPAGSEPPVLVTRVDAHYPEIARRMNLSGEVVLRVVVEESGNIGKVEVVSGGVAGMTEASVDAVKRWVYRPARVDGRPVAVTKIVRVRFSAAPVREPPPD
jgi:TonB family protein